MPETNTSKSRFYLRPTFIIGVMAILAMLVGIAIGRSLEEAGIFAIGVGASTQLIFS